MIRRRRPAYEEKRAQLSNDLRLALDLVEETILSDQVGSFRRTLPDGTVVDLSSYDEFGLIVSFQPAPDGDHEFIDFAVAT